MAIRPELIFFCWAFLWATTAQTDDNLSRVAVRALNRPSALALSHSGKWALLQENDASISVVDTASGGKSPLHEPHVAPLTASWSGDDGLLFIAHDDSISLYQFPGARLLASIPCGSSISHVSLSPDGRYVTAIKEHAVWWAKVSDRRLVPLIAGATPSLLEGEADTVFAAEFDVERHYWWSPDSSAIAFVETEFPPGTHYPLPGGALPIFRLKIIDVASGRMHTVDETNDEQPYLLRAAWHPDGRRMVFYRMNRAQTTAELVLFDGTQLKTVLTEKDGYWLNAPAAPQFLPDGTRIILTSQRSGANHVYACDLTGEHLRDLTRPGLEVYKLHPIVDAQGRVYVAASDGDKQDQHLFSIDAEGGWKQLTSGAGSHDAIVDDRGTGFLDTYSSANSPPSIWWHGAQRAPRALVEASHPANGVVSELQPLRLHDGSLISARLFRPHDFHPQKQYPMIVYIAPGPRGRVAANRWGGWQMAWNRYMTGRGYLVLAVDPRGSGGYGHWFEEYVHFRLGAQSTVDLREVVDLLRQRSYVDPKRIGVWGDDLGAYLVVLSMLDSRDTFKAAFADSAIIDLAKYDAYFSERYLGMPSKHAYEYYDSLASRNVRRIAGTLLLAESPENFLIGPAHLDALRKAIDDAKVKHPSIVRHFQVFDAGDARYREEPDELTRLYAAMSHFFDDIL